MNLVDLPEKLVARLRPMEVRAYATASGWERVDTFRDKIAIYKRAVDHSLEQLLIPLDDTLADYAKRMTEVIEILATQQSRPAVAVLNDLLLPPSDVLRFSLDDPTTEGGSVRLVHGTELLAGIQKAILASACSVVQPQAFHPRLSRSEAEDLLQSCRLGQTERGSFTAVIACPIDAIEGPSIASKPTPLIDAIERSSGNVPSEPLAMPASREPFARKTTSLLMSSITKISTAINMDRVESLMNPNTDGPLISANLCDALLMMQPEGDHARLNVHATWARTLPRSSTNSSPNSASLRSDDFRIVEELATELRPARAPRLSQFIALVDALFGDPDENGAVSGDVQLLVFEGEQGTVRAKVTLNAKDYHVAWQAHGRAGYVSLTGMLKRAGRLSKIEDVTMFKALQEVTA